ncbi:CsbD family protein [Sphingomonas crusticola]|uniref:CsbD family protein n=1 Tax=Sphingomonas crusticola TaxID=1697973 RepID=UPI000E225224|nr:CsbD family protein [Sphingomonas crusticola]
MNDDQLSGEGRDLTGKVKETAGDFTGNSSLQSEGLTDQLTGKAQKAYGAASEALSGGVGPLVDQAKGFARKRPFAAAALLGVVGVAILNTLRGRR